MIGSDMSITPELFHSAMNQAMKGMAGFPGGITLILQPLIKKSILNTNGHRRRKKLRIIKRFRNKYGYRLVDERMIPKGQIYQTPHGWIAHEPEYSRIVNYLRDHPNAIPPRATNMMDLNI